MVGWGVTAIKERERERERDKHTDRLTRVRSFSGEKLPQNATTTTKKKQRSPQTEVHHYEAEMGIFFSSLYNAWHLHSR